MKTAWIKFVPGKFIARNFRNMEIPIEKLLKKFKCKMNYVIFFITIKIKRFISHTSHDV